MKTSLLSAVLFALVVVQTQGFNSNDDCVFITVSSLPPTPTLRGTPGTERLLELNWIQDPVCGSPDQVGLFSSDPRNPNTLDETTLLWVETAQHPAGYLRTKISLGSPSLPGGWDQSQLDGPEQSLGLRGDQCFNYWVASFKENRILHAVCLKIRPTWMRDNKVELSKLSLHQMLLPGTHNAGCYRYHQYEPRRPPWRAFKCLFQEMELWSQLVHGIRYLDLWVGVPWRGPVEFMVNSREGCASPLQPLLDQVLRFMTASSDEIIIIDFNGYQRDPRFVDVLKNSSDLQRLALAPPLPNTTFTLGDIWKQNKRLIVAYGESQAGNNDPEWLWPTLRTGEYYEPYNIETLKSYVAKRMSEPRTNSTALWSVHAVLPARNAQFPLDIDYTDELRLKANSYNRNLTKWIRDEWWQKANVVASDYFLGNYLIDVAIKANLRKAAAIAQAA